MKLCKYCGLVEHELDAHNSIHYKGEYYCSLNCFNNSINKIYELEEKIMFLQERIDELDSTITCMEEECDRVDTLVCNLEEIKVKIEAVYALPFAEDNYKESYEKVDNAISDLVEYYNDEVYID